MYVLFIWNNKAPSCEAPQEPTIYMLQNTTWKRTGNNAVTLDNLQNFPMLQLYQVFSYNSWYSSNFKRLEKIGLDNQMK